MIIDTPEAFDEMSKYIFGNENFNTLSSIPNKIRLQLGEEYDSDERISIANDRAVRILDDLFLEKNIWLRIIVWNENIISKKINYLKDRFLKFQKTVEDYLIIYLEFGRYETMLIQPIVHAIINYEVGDDGENISCFYYDLESFTLANIYDDRGIDIVSLDEIIIERICKKYYDLLL